MAYEILIKYTCLICAALQRTVDVAEAVRTTSLEFFAEAVKVLED